MRSRLLFAGVLLLALFLPSLRADAATSPYQAWVMPPGQLCVQENGMPYWNVGRAAAYYNLSPRIDIVVKPKCTGFPTRRIIQVKTYVDHKVGACAYTARPAQSWTYAYGRWTWVSEATELRFNAAPEAKKACFSKSTGVAHVASHELGHAVGLAHNTDASVMGSWAYWWPTRLDIDRVTARYGG